MKLTYCKPIRGLWDDTIKLKCSIDTTQVMFVNGIVNTVTDAALLLIPLPAIWSLKLETKQKRIGLTAIFLVGILYDESPKPLRSSLHNFTDWIADIWL